MPFVSCRALVQNRPAGAKKQLGTERALTRNPGGELPRSRLGWVKRNHGVAHKPVNLGVVTTAIVRTVQVGDETDV